MGNSLTAGRIIRAIVFSAVLILIYLFVVFPVSYFVHGEGFFISTAALEKNNAIYVNHNVYGLFNIQTPAVKCAYVGGFPIAVALYTDGVIIDDTALVETAFGKTSPSSQLMKGDFLVELNGQKISCASDIDDVLSGLNLKSDIGWKFQSRSRRANAKKNQNKNDNLEDCEKISEIEAVILRDNDKKRVKLKPSIEEFSNKYRLGLVVRDYILGVGTVTFIKEDGSFGALGHPISDSVAGRVPIRGGVVFKCRENGVVKGERGAPGELKVKIGSMKSPIGTISRNTDCGIFGKFNSADDMLSAKKYAQEALVNAHDGKRLHAVSNRKQVCMGNAYICAGIDGTTDYYKVEIIRAVNQSGFADKGLVIRVTDKRLIEKTGGIVQGMSGSPIIQNNMIIGAVTHVFVNEPTKGFGVYIDFMYDY